jgi:hypothetical protein
MRPYYEHAGIVIYHGDARDIVPQLADGIADMILKARYRRRRERGVLRDRRPPLRAGSARPARMTRLAHGRAHGHR